MKLSDFSVVNYRSITTARKIKTNNMTVLVGKNNEGKCLKGGRGVGCLKLLSYIQDKIWNHLDIMIIQLVYLTLLVQVILKMVVLLLTAGLILLPRMQQLMICC